MELTKEQISEFSKAFNVSEIFLEYLSKECNNISEIQEILLKLPDFADENNIPLDIAEKISFIKKTLENDGNENIEIKAFKIPFHNCPLNENEQNCNFCPLQSKNLINITLYNCDKFYESTGQKPDAQIMMETIVKELIKNPDDIRHLIKYQYQLYLKNKIANN